MSQLNSVIQMAEKDERARAVTAAESVLRRIGIPVAASAILHVSQHISVKLSPGRVVARVVSAVDPRAVARLCTELNVAMHLAEKSVPIVDPIADYSPGPYFHGNVALTLWQYFDHEKAADDNPMHMTMAVGALRRIHDGLADFRGPLPDFWDKPDQCRVLLEDHSALPALHPSDRDFLLTAHAELRTALNRLPLRTRPIHGDAHLGNVFITSDDARWHDFEDICQGPREWDISGFADANLAPFEPVNRDALSLFRYLRSLCVCVWCHDKFAIEGKREAAEYHLQYLRAALAKEKN